MKISPLEADSNGYAAGGIYTWIADLEGNVVTKSYVECL